MRLAIASSIVVFASLVACGGPDKPAESASNTATSASTVPSASSVPTTHASAPSGDVVAQVKNSKLTLAQGIAQAEKDNGAAISARFEVEDGKLSLSVYTAKGGLDKDAEHNTLQELSGDPTAAVWQPKTEVFEDKEHITRAAMHLTLVQRAKTSLANVVAKASSQQPGTVYSVIPAVKDKAPGFQVLVATDDGKTVSLWVPGS
jgi:hypothetical protein